MIPRASTVSRKVRTPGRDPRDMSRRIQPLWPSAEF
jgi:hypothetical protein